MMKKIIYLFTTLFCLLPYTAGAYTVYCTNCSTTMIQSIMRTTSMEQLQTLLKEYDEAVTQTAKQIQMVQQNIEQYANMVQNTVQLPAALISEIAGELGKLSQITGSLNTLRGDVQGLSGIFDGLYATQDAFTDLANLPREMVGQGNTQIRQQRDKWAERVDEATKATFQLSGRQLQEMQDSGQLESYINQLLSTPDGQQKALMAGNQLAAIQIQEARQLRELMATKVQSDLASQEKAEKEKQLSEEMKRKILDTEGLDLKPIDDPF